MVTVIHALTHVPIYNPLPHLHAQPRQQGRSGGQIQANLRSLRRSRRPSKRRIYDLYGEEALKSGQVPPPPHSSSSSSSSRAFHHHRQNPPPSFHFNPRDADDIYAELFGSDDSVAASSRRKAFFQTSNGTSSSSSAAAAFSSRKATPVENALPCSLEDLYKGVKKKMKISRNVCDAFGIGTYFCFLLALHGCLATVGVGKLVCHEQTCSLLVSFGKSAALNICQFYFSFLRGKGLQSAWWYDDAINQISRGPKESRGDTSAWTDTPIDRAQKAKMNALAPNKKANPYTNEKDTTISIDSNKIWEIIRLQQILKKWRRITNSSKAPTTVTATTNTNKSMKFLKRTLSLSEREGGSSNVVPKGYLVVCVGEELKRFTIPTKYLGHQAFEILLREAKKEFGFQQIGVLRIPCEVAVFESILKMVKGKEDKFSSQDQCRLNIEEIMMGYCSENQLAHHSQSPLCSSCPGVSPSTPGVETLTSSVTRAKPNVKLMWDANRPNSQGFRREACDMALITKSVAESVSRL
ncbi:hypothetical protein Fmac_032120 [Flemingia macrophylla]|uniref:Uncharacterized protein n=1 Tax=Flemingia macrophylla TaxID=520843 RepID=A0ABD1L416_9FABA